MLGGDLAAARGHSMELPMESVAREQASMRSERGSLPSWSAPKEARVLSNSRIHTSRSMPQILPPSSYANVVNAASTTPRNNGASPAAPGPPQQIRTSTPSAPGTVRQKTPDGVRPAWIMRGQHGQHTPSRPNAIQMPGVYNTNSLPTSAGPSPTSMQMPMQAAGAIPMPAMQMLETKFKDIVEAHVQELLTTLEASLESHHADLSGRIEQIELRLGQVDGVPPSHNKQNPMTVLNTLRHQVTSMSEEFEKIRSSQSCSSIAAEEGQHRLMGVVEAQQRSTSQASALVGVLQRQVSVMQAKLEGLESRPHIAMSAAVRERSLSTSPQRRSEELRGAGEFLETCNIISSRVDECFSALRSTDDRMNRLDSDLDTVRRHIDNPESLHGLRNEINAELQKVANDVANGMTARIDTYTREQVEVATAFRADFRSQLLGDLEPLRGSLQAQEREIAALARAMSENSSRPAADLDGPNGQRRVRMQDCKISVVEPAVTVTVQAQGLDEDERRALRRLAALAPLMAATENAEFASELPAAAFARLQTDLLHKLQEMRRSNIAEARPRGYTNLEDLLAHSHEDRSHLLTEEEELRRQSTPRSGLPSQTALLARNSQVVAATSPGQAPAVPALTSSMSEPTLKTQSSEKQRAYLDLVRLSIGGAR